MGKVLREILALLWKAIRLVALQWLRQRLGTIAKVVFAVFAVLVAVVMLLVLR